MTARAWGVIFLLVLAILGSTAIWLRCEGVPPEFQAPSELALGADAAAITVSTRDPGSGVRSVRATLRHAGGESVVFEQELIGNPLVGGPRPRTWEDIRVEIDAKALGLAEGDAFLVVEAHDWSWRDFLRGNAASVEVPIRIDLTQPRISISNGLTYVQRAGSATVAYRLSEETVRDGVTVGDHFFPGYPVPGAPTPRDRIAIFAIPRDVEPDPKIQVVAEDASGNRGAAGWSTRLQERAFDDVRLNLTDGFLRGKVSSLAEELGIPAEDPIRAFQTINQDERKRNEQTIREAVAQSSPAPLFEGAFVQMRNSAVTSRFAEHRSYFLGDRQVSEAIHFGYDLASTAGAPIEAAGAGRVLYADALGIYGNCVILDHGLGLTSLYAHLTSIDVAVGDQVEKRQALGRSGATGLAGGDHLHFAMMVGESYVDPKEWWDPKWVRDHVAPRLPAVLPESGD